MLRRIHKIFFGIIFTLVVFPLIAYPKADNFQYMLSNDVNIVEVGNADATVEWGGKEVKISDLAKYPRATQKIWNRLGHNDKVKLLGAYKRMVTGGVPAGLQKHFGPEVTKTMYKFYFSN